MKKHKNSKSKFFMFTFALAMPFAAATSAYAGLSTNEALAETTSKNYYSGYSSEVSLSNNNFNSSSSYTTLISSPTGWTKTVYNGTVTAGVINVGNSFQSNMSGSFKLSNNPLSKASDKYILMINSKTDSDSDDACAKFRSNSISLAANSFYSFQASFKADTNYESYTAYVEKDTVPAGKTGYVYASDFSGATFKLDDDVYVPFTFNSKTYYVKKNLSFKETLTNNIENIVRKADRTTTYDDYIFYEDSAVVGIVKDGDVMFVKKTDLEDVDEVYVKNETPVSGYRISSGKDVYNCNLEYEEGNNRFVVEEGTKYYTTKTEYTSLNDYVSGAIFLDGLKDADGKDVEVKFDRLSSKNWTTVYFFVATGNEAQNVSFDLYLGSKDKPSSGVVFFDDCHVYQHSQNTFYKTLQAYGDKKHAVEKTNLDGSVSTILESSVKYVDFSEDKTIDTFKTADFNFDFEQPIFGENGKNLTAWTKSGSGLAQIFDVKSPNFFDGYDFVGSDLSCKAVYDASTNTVTSITENAQVLGLCAKDNFVKVTSNKISVESNAIYKISAKYKISNIESGNAYVSVVENDKVLSDYELSQYSVASEVYSTALSSNGSENFSNSYSTVEFFVKGNALYNSYVNLALSLGKADESATGAVVFDSITIERATESDYSGASNKISLGPTWTSNAGIENGTFNSATIVEDNDLLSPSGWTVTKGSENNFFGVINTDAQRYQGYVDAGYAWAIANPKSQNGKTTPNNILMLSNITNSYQSVKSSNFTISNSSDSDLTCQYYRLRFDYKNIGINKSNSESALKLSLFLENGTKIFESDDFSETEGTWRTFEISIKSSELGSETVYAQIDFGTSENKIGGNVYLDNFSFETIDATVVDVDLSNFMKNLPTNAVEENVVDSPAYNFVTSSTDNNLGERKIVKGKYLKDAGSVLFENGTEDKDFFYLTSQGKGVYYVESNFNINLKSGKYYALSFKLKSYFNEVDDSEVKFGAHVGLTGFDYLENLVSSDEYQTYTIYFKPSEDASTKLHIALDAYNGGAISIYDTKLETLTEDEFNLVKEEVNAKDYNFEDGRKFITKANDAEVPEEDEKPENEEKTSPSSSELNWSIYVASAITGLAIIIAVIGYALSKVKIRKIERKKKESYDRAKSLIIDRIKGIARKQRDAEANEIKAKISNFETELASLEKEHKAKVLALREKDQGVVSKETDKAFKSFAQKRTVISEKLSSLNRQLEEKQSPEYLLSLEREIYAKEEMKARQLLKESKKENKKNEK